jgi:NAD(P)-dependent dehydrogenase (short-subunit alcohol dehydrogenase family)
MHDLAGKTMLLTGASKGIGAATAAALGAAGAHLVAHYGTDRAGAEAATAGLPGERRLLVTADLGVGGEVDRLWAEALAWRGRVDVLVNNAAAMRLAGGIEAEEAEWDTVWDEAWRVNVLAPARLMRHAVRHCLDRGGGGTIVTVSSWAAQRGPGNPALLAYAASKGAVLAATKAIARNYAARGVLAYAVAPGVVRTRLSELAAAATGGEAAVTATLAMGDWVPPAEVADLIAYLATGTCRHLSGATLDVNGASYIR